MAELLRIEDVTAGYRDTVVLERVSLVIGPEESWALLGRNGVGKTTVLLTVMGVTELRTGRIEFRGEDLTRADTHRRAQHGLGFVPQEREIFPSLTVEENLRVARRAGEWTIERVYDLFPHLGERRRHYGNQLSGGEQQMLAVGRALAGNPQLLMLDEPFEGLAPVVIDALAEALMRLRRESRVATLLVEQQVDIALELTNSAIVLDKGQVVWRGESAALATDRGRLATLVGFQETQASGDRLPGSTRRPLNP
jgi:branched-chain amino acid transport system ATP-binding protein